MTGACSLVRLWFSAAGPILTPPDHWSTQGPTLAPSTTPAAATPILRGAGT